MAREPSVEQRGEQPYVGIHARVANESEFRGAVDRGFPALFAWVDENGVTPSGPPFIRYLEIDRDGQPVEFEIAVPVADSASGGGPVRAGALPAGPYATFLHVGPYSSSEAPDLSAARAELLRWVHQRGIDVVSETTDQGVAYGAYVENYITDASKEPDWSKWKTELAYLVDEG